MSNSNVTLDNVDSEQNTDLQINNTSINYTF